MNKNQIIGLVFCLFLISSLGFLAGNLYEDHQLHRKRDNKLAKLNNLYDECLEKTRQMRDSCDKYAELAKIDSSENYSYISLKYYDSLLYWHDSSKVLSSVYIITLEETAP